MWARGGCSDNRIIPAILKCGLYLVTSRYVPAVALGGQEGAAKVNGFRRGFAALCQQTIAAQIELGLRTKRRLIKTGFRINRRTDNHRAIGAVAIQITPRGFFCGGQICQRQIHRVTAQHMRIARLTAKAVFGKSVASLVNRVDIKTDRIIGNDFGHDAQFGFTVGQIHAFWQPGITLGRQQRRP